ncbi:MAG: hypothetical protein WDN00_12265 [Limisphaerales bacterium]
MSREDTIVAGQTHAEFPEKELVTGRFADNLCGSREEIAKDILWQESVN